MRFVTVTDVDTGTVLATRARWCASSWQRCQGLMLRGSLPSGEGAVLTPCASIHMAFMRFAIDVLFVDRSNTIVKIVRDLRPYRATLGGRKAHSAIELPAGTLLAANVSVGDTVEFDPPLG